MAAKLNNDANGGDSTKTIMKPGKTFAELLASVPIAKIMEAGQFVLNYGLSDTRQELLVFLVKSVLLGANEEKPMSSTDIAAEISSKFGTYDKYPLPLVELSLQSLKESRCIQEDANKTPAVYWLSNETMTEVQQLHDAVSDMQRNVMGHLVKEITEDCKNASIGAQEDITRCIYSLFGNLFAMHGYEAAALLVDYQVGIGHLYELPDLGIAIDKATANVQDRALRAAIHSRFSHMLQNPNSMERQFFAMMALGYIVAAVLNLDPELRRVSEAVLGHSVYLLDTNILLPLLVPQSRFYEVTRRLVNVAKITNIKLVLAKRTKDELVHMMRKSSLARVKVPKDLSPELLHIMSEIVDDEIASTYFSKPAKAPAMKWEDFVKIIERIDEVLKISYDIKLVERHHDEVVAESDRLLEATIEVMDLWDKRYPLRQPKSEWVAEHDAFIYLVARKMQEDCLSRQTLEYAYILTVDRDVVV